MRKTICYHCQFYDIAKVEKVSETATDCEVFLLPEGTCGVSFEDLLRKSGNYLYLALP